MLNNKYNKKTVLIRAPQLAMYSENKIEIQSILDRSEPCHDFVVESSILGRFASGSSPFSWLLHPLMLCGPNRDACLLVICRPARTFGPQCGSGFGRKRATFLACDLLREANALAKLACSKLEQSTVLSHNWWSMQFLKQRVLNIQHMYFDFGNTTILMRYVIVSWWANRHFLGEIEKGCTPHAFGMLDETWTKLLSNTP